MKCLLTYIILLLLTACSKDFESKLEGKWKMVGVIDNITGVSQTKTGSGDVIINLVLIKQDSGLLDGHTQSNRYWGSFITDASVQFKLVSGGLTHVGEPAWGSVFCEYFGQSKSISFFCLDKAYFTGSGKTFIFEKL